MPPLYTSDAFFSQMADSKSELYIAASHVTPQSALLFSCSKVGVNRLWSKLYIAALPRDPRGPRARFACLLLKSTPPYIIIFLQ